MTIDAAIDAAIDALARHPAVRGVQLVGSRAAGTPTPLSDWDFAVASDDFPQVAREISSLFEPLRPLAQQWDRLSDTWCWMVIVAGPIKLDFIFDEWHEAEPPWRPTGANLAAIDRHFWDWMLWLAAKQTGNRSALVRRELAKVWVNILFPMGVTASPVVLDEAVASYLASRDRLEQRFDISVPRALEHEVRTVIDGVIGRS